MTFMERHRGVDGDPKINAGLARPASEDSRSPSVRAQSSYLSKIEALDGDAVRRLFIPIVLLNEIEKASGCRLSDADIKDIVCSQSMLNAIEAKLDPKKTQENPNGKAQDLANGQDSKLDYDKMHAEYEKKAVLRKLNENEVRQMLLANGVKERHVNVNGVSTFFLEAGNPKKPTVLLIHGGGNSASYRAWKYQILELAENYHVIAPDLPGFGNTPKPKEKCTLDFYVKNFIGKFMDAVGVQKADIVSSSMGGWIALGFTLENPGRVNKLVGIGSGGLSDKQIPLLVRELTIFPKFSKFLIDKLHKNERIVKKVLSALTGEKNVSEKFYKMTDEYLDKDGFTPAFLEFLNDQLQSSPREVAADYLRHKRENIDIIRGFRTVYLNSFEVLNKANIPYLLAHGKQDPIFALPSIETAAQKLEHCTLVEFECMHGPHLEIPQEFNPVLQAFLSNGQETQTEEGKHRFKELLRGITSKLKLTGKQEE